MKAIVFALALLLTSQRQETRLVVQSWKYNPETKDLTLTLVNLSGKDIIAYNISISDGSTDYFGRPSPPGEYMEDSLASLISQQMTGEKPRTIPACSPLGQLVR